MSPFGGPRASTTYLHCDVSYVLRGPRGYGGTLVYLSLRLAYTHTPLTHFTLLQLPTTPPPPQHTSHILHSFNSLSHHHLPNTPHTFYTPSTPYHTTTSPTHLTHLVHAAHITESLHRDVHWEAVCVHSGY